MSRREARAAAALLWCIVAGALATFAAAAYGFWWLLGAIIP